MNFSPYRVVRRDGSASDFDPTKISHAVTRAFLAVEGNEAFQSNRLRDQVEAITEEVVNGLTRHPNGERLLYIEDIQDRVELALMRGEHHKVARAYVLYREERKRVRPKDERPPLSVVERDGTKRPLDLARLRAQFEKACAGLEDVDADALLSQVQGNLYNGIKRQEVLEAAILASRSLIETEPNYSAVTARLLLEKLKIEANRFLGNPESYFQAYVSKGVEVGLLDPELKNFDLFRLSEALIDDRDLQFQYLGLQTLYDRYLLHWEGERFELPQAFFMRVAMGLAMREVDREERAIEFYRLLSSFDFMCSTPTLFNSGTTRPQLSSCFLSTVPDDLQGIFSSIQDNALLSKYAGGLGNDWTPVRGLGSAIRGTNGKSQGVVPFLKVANDAAVAVNQGGKRKGAVCAYLETWHVDVDEFLELRKNTGDERRRTHDMNTANWVPDLFLKRVEEEAEWTLFSPDETPDLHDLYGKDFEERYLEYEKLAKLGELRVFRTVQAVTLWRKMLTMLFETGHPWITFKDPCNLRSPQQHQGVVHSSNLCTEITLNTKADEVAVCNLGSVNLAHHTTAAGLDRDRLSRTIKTAVRMLDNVIDINFYTIPQARRSNLRHRPVGLGLMGFQDALHIQKLPYASSEAVEFADRSAELVSYLAIESSIELSTERGSYPSYEGSLWSQGVLPIDSLEILSQHRGGHLEVDRVTTLDWDSLRQKLESYGIRNSNLLAIAPTATIANICGVSQSIEPTYQNLFVKSNMSGDFTVLNPYLVKALKERGLWDEVMTSDLKYFDGRLGPIERVPEELKELFATAFELDSSWLVEAASRRQKWLDQAQSLNLYLQEPSGSKLDALYRLAWKRGLKTTYYLRCLGASHVEKSTLAKLDGKLNAVCNDDICEVCQ